MVVLESHTHSGSLKGGISVAAPNQYLQPDYLSPTSLDSKKSPLAMLVATCSQIGADPPSSKFNSSSKKPTSPTQNSTEANNFKRGTPPTPNRQKSVSPSSSLPKTPPSKSPKLVMDEMQEEKMKHHSQSHHQQNLKRPRSSSSIASASTISPIPPPKKEKHGSPPPPAPREERKESSSSAQASPTPTIRSGMEVLNGGQRHGHPAFHNIPMYPPGYPSPYGGGAQDPFAAAMMMNPAFRGHFQPSPYYQANPYANPYLNLYSGRKPECKDPYCTSCPPASMQPQVAICPAGCAQCDHQKVPYPFPFYHQAPVQPQAVPTSVANSGSQQSHSPSAQQQSQGRPHVCNWIVGENYCGKRFTTSEDLLVHLRTHTSSAAQASAENNAAAASASAIALQQHLAASALYSQHPSAASMLHQMQMTNPLAAAMQQMQQMQMRGYPTSPPISPYGTAKPGSMNLVPGYYPQNPYGLFPSRP